MNNFSLPMVLRQLPMSLLTVMAEDSGDNLDSWEDQVDSGVIYDQF